MPPQPLIEPEADADCVAVPVPDADCVAVPDVDRLTNPEAVTRPQSVPDAQPVPPTGALTPAGPNTSRSGHPGRAQHGQAGVRHVVQRDRNSEPERHCGAAPADSGDARRPVRPALRRG